MAPFIIPLKEKDYNMEVADDPNTDPKILKMILQIGKNDFTSWFAAQNPSCPPEALKMVLERGENNLVSQFAAQNKNCPLETKIKWMIKFGWISRFNPEEHEF